MSHLVIILTLSLVICLGGLFKGVFYLRSHKKRIQFKWDHQTPFDLVIAFLFSLVSATVGYFVYYLWIVNSTPPSLVQGLVVSVPLCGLSVAAMWTVFVRMLQLLNGHVGKEVAQQMDKRVKQAITMPAYSRPQAQTRQDMPEPPPHLKVLRNKWSVGTVIGTWVVIAAVLINAGLQGPEVFFGILFFAAVSLMFYPIDLTMTYEFKGSVLHRRSRTRFWLNDSLDFRDVVIVTEDLNRKRKSYLILKTENGKIFRIGNDFDYQPLLDWFTKTAHFERAS